MVRWGKEVVQLPGSSRPVVSRPVPRPLESLRTSDPMNWPKEERTEATQQSRTTHRARLRVTTEEYLPFTDVDVRMAEQHSQQKQFEHKFSL